MYFHKGKDINLAGIGNEARNHQYRMCCGQTPLETLLDGKRIGQRKLDLKLTNACKKSVTIRSSLTLMQIKKAGSSTGGRPPVNPPPIPLTVRPFGIPLSTDYQRLMRLDRARQLKQADYSERWALE